MNNNIEAVPTNTTQKLTITRKSQVEKIIPNCSTSLYRYKTAIKPRIKATPFIAVKHMCTMLIMALFFISMTLVLEQEAYAALGFEGNSVKWHPGHYYTIMDWGKNNSKYLEQVYREIEETPALRGVQIRYNWA